MHVAKILSSVDPLCFCCHDKFVLFASYNVLCTCSMFLYEGNNNGGSDLLRNMKVGRQVWFATSVSLLEHLQQPRETACYHILTAK
jgi:hypothetical protein